MVPVVTFLNYLNFQQVVRQKFSPLLLLFSPLPPFSPFLPLPLKNKSESTSIICLSHFLALRDPSFCDCLDFNLSPGDYYHGHQLKLNKNFEILRPEIAPWVTGIKAWVDSVLCESIWYTDRYRIWLKTINLGDFQKLGLPETMIQTFQALSP